jgi:two-component system, cell cycle sensor histidine kinase and response regulator CckA
MKTILIVEDEPGNMQVFCWLLSLRGYNVLEAATGKEAIDAVNKVNGVIDLILCDLMLPDISGTRLARQLVESQPNAAVLIVSGAPRTSWSETETDDFGELSQELTDVLEKPFLPAALEMKIEQLLKKRPCAKSGARAAKSAASTRWRP